MRTYLLILGFVASFASFARAEFFWIQGEKPDKATMNRHPWYDQVKKDRLSGGDWISNFEPNKIGEAEYSVKFIAQG
jgi:hypothetical protein